MERSVFVSDLGLTQDIADPRQRAPLGMKTTNPKARLNQTPAAPGTLKPEKTNKRTSTQKVKKIAPLVQQNDAEVAEKPAQVDVPDIEYMPPKPQGGNSDFVLMKGLLLISRLQSFRTSQTTLRTTPRFLNSNPRTWRGDWRALTVITKWALMDSPSGNESTKRIQLHRTRWWTR